MDFSGRSGEMMVFVTVMEQGSLSAAARALQLAPSAVSRVIARIEARLGVRLLIRTTRTLTLTAEGQTYLRAARRILADLTEVEEAIADQASPRGRVRLTASLAHGRLYVVPLLAEFTARYPDILVDLNLSDRVVDILGGQADVAIRFGQLADSPLTARRIGETGRVVVASPSYLARHGTPEQPEDLFRHNCLSFSFRRAEPGWPFRRGGVDMAPDVTGSIEANNGESLAQLALAGVGIARIGTFAVKDELADGRLIPLLEAFNPQDREPLHLLFVGGSTMPARVRVLIDFLAERLGDGA
ncbi:LysR family transcriptional regulator [Sphingomonas ginsenosidimutans]|jgi:DNA-binding transcriptional LysR family regulator|uniref:LysR family transcriptional regulator n=1 Tax=Sphingomonas ginsenosidimutans TaxID=862134 RepID=A0A2A4HVA8_9SPHN|nr:LysR family transcriptional regulator [Sphingomonas ginsenosidimutans]